MSPICHNPLQRIGCGMWPRAGFLRTSGGPKAGNNMVWEISKGSEPRHVSKDHQKITVIDEWISVNSILLRGCRDLYRIGLLHLFVASVSGLVDFDEIFMIVNPMEE